MRQMQRLILLGLCLALSAGASSAQSQAQPQAPVTQSAAAPAANQAEVASPDAIISSVYGVISGPAGQKRDWDRMRSLFYPDARLIRTAPKKEGGMGATSLTVQATGANDVLEARESGLNILRRFAQELLDAAIVFHA